MVSVLNQRKTILPLLSFLAKRHSLLPLGFFFIQKKEKEGVVSGAEGVFIRQDSIFYAIYL